MTDFKFNVALGRFRTYAELGAVNDALIFVFLETSGLEAASALRVKTTLADVLSGSTNEQTTVGRKTLTGVTVTVDNVGSKVVVDADDLSLVGPTGNAISQVLLCYDGDTTGGTDADIVPIGAYDCSFTPDGNDRLIRINSLGLFDAS
jgi:hypothetical protein